MKPAAYRKIELHLLLVVVPRQRRSGHQWYLNEVECGRLGGLHQNSDGAQRVSGSRPSPYPYEPRAQTARDVVTE